MMPWTRWIERHLLNNSPFWYFAERRSCRRRNAHDLVALSGFPYIDCRTCIRQWKVA